MDLDAKIKQARPDSSGSGQKASKKSFLVLTVGGFLDPDGRTTTWGVKDGGGQL